MKVGDYVKVSAIHKVGKIIESNPRRLPDRPATISFYVVEFPDGSTQEFGREELRHATEQEIQLIKYGIVMLKGI